MELTSEFETFLFGIAKNVALEDYRRRAKQVLTLEAVSPGEEPRVDPGDGSLDLPKWNQDLYHECLAQCLETLDQEQRAQLLLFYQGRGKGERKRIRKQLAQRLGTNTRALSSRILRLRSKLDRCIKSCVERRRLK
jgi:DNA-directed RNA polymerase specialized sigma24 family protein